MSKLHKETRRTNRMRGFTIVELLVVVLIVVILTVIALPSLGAMLGSYRAASDAKSLASQVALVKMRAGSDFTQARLNCNLGGNSCQPEVCTVKGVSTCTTWTVEGGARLLSQGVSFGFGSISTAAGTQTTIQNSTPIVFNSRGIPIDGTGAATGNNALYVTDANGRSYAVTVSASGHVSTWRHASAGWVVQ